MACEMSVSSKASTRAWQKDSVSRAGSKAATAMAGRGLTAPVFGDVGLVIVMGASCKVRGGW